MAPSCRYRSAGRGAANLQGIYIVDEVAHSGPPDRIEITARSADFRDEFNIKREVSWHDVTVERIVSAIAHRYKLKPVISEQLINAEIDHADQTRRAICHS